MTDTLDKHFPKTINQPGPVTMQQLADLKTGLRKALPADSIVEITLLLQTVCLSVWVPGHGWHSRVADVSHEAEPAAPAEDHSFPGAYP